MTIPEIIASQAEPAAMRQLSDAYTPCDTRFRPEESPFSTLFVDITHRCNMECHNCYIPVRELPDMPADWLYEILGRLPRRTRIRLVGAEPTMREDLPDMIRQVRKLGHIPIILSNGLKLGRPSYVKKLKQNGLGTVYLSLNGGLKDELYEAIDGMPVAARKLKALDNLLAHRFHVTVGTILIPGLNTDYLPDFLSYLIDRGVRDFHFRSVGKTGRHMPGEAFDLDGLEQCLRSALPASAGELLLQREYSSSRDFTLGRRTVQVTEWPEMGSLERGRITPDGFVEPMFESILANEFVY